MNVLYNTEMNVEVNTKNSRLRLAAVAMSDAPACFRSMFDVRPGCQNLGENESVHLAGESLALITVR